MRRLPCILALSLCLVPQAFAREGEGNEAKRSAPPEDLSTELESFVRDALDEGLLTPVAPKGAPEKPPAQEVSHGDAPPAPAAAVEPVPQRAASVKPDPVKPACAAAGTLDFEHYAEFHQYQDIYAFRNGDGTDEGENGLALPKAYITLGMYSEALMELKQLHSPEAEVLQNLAVMLERRRVPDVEVFQAQASCVPEDGIWLAAAQLAAGDASGAVTLNDFVTDFRKLPLHLRVDLAGIIIPELVRAGQKTMARRMIADFTEEQMSASQDLQFIKALVEFEDGNRAAGEKVHGYLDHPQFQDQALAALLDQNAPLDPVREDVLLSELMRKFGQTGSGDASLGTSIEFALRELSERSRYDPIIELAATPALQNSAGQAEVKRQLVASLQRDLGSAESIRNLAAIGLLAGGPAILDDVPERAHLYNLAAGRAVDFGFSALAEKIAAEADLDAPVAERVAGLAFRRGSYGAVYSMADHHPHDEALNRLAALSAVRSDDRSKLAEFEARLPKDPETILALIEEDAASGHWIVSAGFYQAARHLTGEDHVRRVQRIEALRRSVSDAEASPPLEIASAQAPESGGFH